MGIIPTDTCYSFVTQINNAEGIKRILHLKDEGMKKPLSLLCKDIATISRYSSNLCDQKWVFKILKNSLPGPYTYILPSSKEVPSILVDHKKHMRRWKRREIGVRIPHDAICASILQDVGDALISGSVPEFREDEDISLVDGLKPEDTSLEASDLSPGLPNSGAQKIAWMGRWLDRVDFIVESDERVGSHEVEGRSTVVDLTSGDAVVLRKGKGRSDIFSERT